MIMAMWRGTVLMLDDIGVVLAFRIGSANGAAIT